MPAAHPPLDTAELLKWSNVKERTSWSGLLTGNGASIAFWRDFEYQSLYERARSELAKYALTAEDVAIFDAFGTTNFEEVLAALKTSRRTLEALSRDASFATARYTSIQRALFEAVRAAHVPWGYGLRFESKLERIRTEMRAYRFVYTINYDLILYWAAMSKPPRYEIVDFFWPEGRRFDPLQTEPPSYVPADATRLLFLHGALHLRHHVSGSAFKTQAQGRNLLDQFQTTAAGTEVPLLVSEGDGESKRRAIDRSPYLSFALDALGSHEGGVVVFGCSLRDEDSHLVDAIRKSPSREIAFSIRPSNDAATIIRRKAQVRDSFPESDLYFYDATSHPLGDPKLEVKRSRLPFRRS